ncbi:hypothetical protein [Chryseobacterium sp. W4I1]|uniref:hypothetical protein n=1 Tax=Chryseobacterium sp. W4I1 TaxID=3042293 RepID=UPI00278068AB|nr:hypothetical protein [Chryseobacterium sp. W4I1]MDQ0783618.1 F0F1-type ATP synthase assembly protein I [Chryseobacterium sp. W4I1]
MENMTSSYQWSLIITVLIGTLAIVVNIVLWTKYIYGRQAKELENILNETDE